MPNRAKEHSPSDDRVSRPSRGQHAQSSVEYLVSYGWAVVIIAVAVGLLVYFITLPQTIAPSTCSVGAAGSGVNCIDIAVATNTTTHQGYAYLYLSNSNLYAISDVSANVLIAGVNTTTNTCSPNSTPPNSIPAGGTIFCNVTLKSSVSPAQLVTGTVYVRYTACGLLRNYTTTKNCAGAPSQIAVGTFAAHAQGSGVVNTTTLSSLSTVPTSQSTTSLQSSTTTTIIVQQSTTSTTSSTSSTTSTSSSTSTSITSSTSTTSTSSSTSTSSTTTSVTSGTTTSTTSTRTTTSSTSSTTTRTTTSSTSSTTSTSSSTSTVVTSTSSSSATTTGYYSCNSCNQPQLGYTCPNNCVSNGGCGPGGVYVACPASSTTTTSITSTTSTSSTSTSVVSTSTSTTSTTTSIATTSIVIYVTNYASDTVLALSTTGSVLQTYTVGSEPEGIAVANNGNILVTNYGSSTISDIDPQNGKVSNVTVSGYTGPYGIVVDPSGNVWVTYYSSGWVLEFTTPTPNAVAYDAYPVGSSSSNPGGISAASNGSIWVADYGNTSVTSIRGTGGTIKNHALTGIPYFTAVDSSGNVWVTAKSSSPSYTLAKLSGSTGSVLNTYSPTYAYGITIDPSGNIWVTNYPFDGVTELSSSGTTKATYSTGSATYGITVDPSGNIWVTNADDPSISEITTGGTVNTYYLSDGVEPEGIAVSTGPLLQSSTTTSTSTTTTFSTSTTTTFTTTTIACGSDNGCDYGVCSAGYTCTRINDAECSGGSGYYCASSTSTSTVGSTSSTSTQSTSTSSIVVGGSVYGTTQISLADGTSQDASDVQVGDLITSYNLQTHQLSPSVVTQVHVFNASDKYTFNDMLQVDGGEVLYVNGAWTIASAAKVGDKLYDPITQQNITITSINVTNYGTLKTVYDFTASPINDYIADGVLAYLDSTTVSVSGNGVATLANGNPVLVSQLTVGTVIAGYDPQTNRIVPTVVTKVLAINSPNLYLINNGTLAVDSEEGLYVNGQLQLAKNLTVGDRLYNPITQQNITVSNIRIEYGNFTLYDVIASPTIYIVVNGYAIT